MIRIIVATLLLGILSAQVTSAAPLTFEDIPWETIPVAPFPAIPEAILEKLEVWRATRELQATAHVPIPAPIFYQALGEYDATASLDSLQPFLREDMRPLLRFLRLDMDWSKRFEDILSLVPDSVCILDFPAGEFHGPAIENFVRETGAKEIVLSWGLANNIEQSHVLVDMAKDIEGALEHVKRGNPDCFVWVTVCVGVEGTLEWAELIKDLPFDGVALWGPYYIPVGEGRDFLDRPLQWAKTTFPNKPVVLAGFFGAKGVWAGNKIAQGKAPGEATRAILVAQSVGYSAIWLQAGQYPNRPYWSPQ